jgi:hypothetical protein
LLTWAILIIMFQIPPHVVGRIAVLVNCLVDILIVVDITMHACTCKVQILWIVLELMALIHKDSFQIHNWAMDKLMFTIKDRIIQIYTTVKLILLMYTLWTAVIYKVITYPNLMLTFSLQTITCSIIWIVKVILKQG